LHWLAFIRNKAPISPLIEVFKGIDFCSVNTGVLVLHEDFPFLRERLSCPWHVEPGFLACPSYAVVRQQGSQFTSPVPPQCKERCAETHERKGKDTLQFYGTLASPGPDKSPETRQCLFSVSW